MRNFFAIISILCSFLAIKGQAAVPPLSDEMRSSIASDVVVATVSGISSEIVNVSQGANEIFQVMLKVNSVEKGRLHQGNMIIVYFWKMHSRPDGWCGRTGQYGVMELGAQIRAFMTTNDRGEYQLVEPNGFDVLSTTMVPYFSTVRESDALKSALGEFSFQFMTLTQTYRCPGCYRFNVVGTKNNLVRIRGMMTSLDTSTNVIDVTTAQ